MKIKLSILFVLIIATVVTGVFYYNNSQDVAGDDDIKMADSSEEFIDTRFNLKDEQTPIIDSLTPTSGPVGTRVQIKGRNFDALGSPDLWGNIGFISSDGSNIVNMNLYPDINGDYFFTIPTRYTPHFDCPNGVICSAPFPVNITNGNYGIKVYSYSQPIIQSNVVIFTVTD